MTLPSTTLSNQNTITDVVDFFFDLTEKYENFERDIVSIIAVMPNYSPQQIFDACNKIWETRNKLASLDKQMFEIIELAGNEIAHSPIVTDYRTAFENTQIACSHLYQELNKYKANLQKEATPASSPHIQ